jgi:hypothetical protein
MNFFAGRAPLDHVGQKADEVGAGVTAGGFAVDLAGLYV